MMGGRLNIVSVCRLLPTPQEPTAGVFVLKRISAMSEVANVRVVQPVPFMPLVRPLPDWAREPSRRLAGLEIWHAPMAYIPGVLKSLDAMWLARAVGPVLDHLRAASSIDLLDAHFGYPDGAGCVRTARGVGLPTFVTLRGLEHDRIGEAFVGGQLAAALRQAAGCIAVGSTLETLALRSGVETARLRVIHNAIDGDLFSRGDRAAARVRLGLRGDFPLVVSVGRLVSGKRHHVLIEAFAQLRRNVPETELVIVGAPSFEPQYPARLRRQVQLLGLEGAVRFTGDVPQAQVVDWLRAANVFALLSAREGCCNAVLEALAVGIPVVATAAGDNAKFVRSDVNGAIVPFDDVSAAMRSLAAVVSRRDWNAEGISAALSAQVGSWRVVAGRVVEFFHEMLAQRSALHASARA